jgi:hypothetical protein
MNDKPSCEPIKLTEGQLVVTSSRWVQTEGSAACLLFKLSHVQLLLFWACAAPSLTAVLLCDWDAAKHTFMYYYVLSCAECSNCAASPYAVLQIQTRLEDPLGAEQGRGISHQTGIKKMLKQLQEELDAMASPSTVIDIVGERIVLPIDEAADSNDAEEAADAEAPPS